MLADLTGAALKSLGLNNDISASADYTASQAWAQAIHDASPHWDGIRYVSRQMNKGFAYAVFERTGLRKLKAEKLKARQVDDLCDRFNWRTTVSATYRLADTQQALEDVASRKVVKAVIAPNG